jgi:NhaA family Na+:H+ antiporter
MKAGIHPALGLLPMIPTMPHADSDPGIFAWVERGLRDTLNQFEHQMKGFVEIVLGLFGLFNAGVVFSSMGDATWLVLAGLIIGKPLGIWGLGMFAAKGLKMGLPEGMSSKELWVVGCVAAIGFTVALFIAAVAFETGNPVQDAAKMGALLSFFAAVVSLIMARILRIQKLA